MAVTSTAATTSLDNTRPQEQQQQEHQIIPPDRPHPRPHLTLLRNKTLSSPPQWSRRRCPKPTTLLNKFNYESHSNSNDPLRVDFEPPTSPAYWKERCQRFQLMCQSSRKRLREMEEDQRQLRRRIHSLEDRLTSSSAAFHSDKNIKKNQRVRSVTPNPGAEKAAATAIAAAPQSVPSMIIVADPASKRECFYMADCEGMSDSEYGEHYYCTFDHEDEEEDDDDDETHEEPARKKAKTDEVKHVETEIATPKEMETKEADESKEEEEQRNDGDAEQRDDKE